MSSRKQMPEPQRPEARVELVLRLGRALHQHGAPAHRLEQALGEVATALGLSGKFFATPTALFSSIGDPAEERTHLDRLNPADVNLGTLAELDRLAQAVIRGDVDVARATREIAELEAGERRYPLWLVGVGAALASGSAALLFGGGWLEAAAAAILGGLVGGLSPLAAATLGLGRLWETVAAVLVSLGAAWLAWSEPVSGSIVVISGLIVLVPGLTLTVGVTELAQGSLVSGTSRLAGAVLSLILLGFGALLGARAASALGWQPLGAQSAELPLLVVTGAVVTTAAAFAVLLQAQVRDAPWIVVAGLATWGGAFAASSLGPVLAAFVGAAIAGSVSNLYARALHRPAMIPRVGAILVLVPGALGFRGITALLFEDTVGGLQTAANVLFIAVAITVGLMLAGSVVPPRQTL